MREGTLDRLAEDDRWLLDDPPAAAWFRQAIDLSWTRDPFDRLLVAHARLRGWRFATSDTALLKRLSHESGSRSDRGQVNRRRTTTRNISVRAAYT